MSDSGRADSPGIEESVVPTGRGTPHSVCPGRNRDQTKASPARQVTDALIEAGALPADRVDAGVVITEITDELPRESDLDRVRTYLVANGWPIDDDWSER